MADIGEVADIFGVLARAAADRGPSVPDLLSDRDPAATALVHDDRAISFAALDDRARRIAAGLARLGVGEGDRVAIWLPNVPEYLEAFIACCHLGAIAVAVNTRFRSVEVGDILGRTGSKVLVFAPRFKGIDFPAILRDVDPAALSALETVLSVGEAAGADGIAHARTRPLEAVAEAAPLAESRARADRPAKIFTTSGTTSGPKFVLHNQATASRHGIEVARALGYDAPDAVILQAVPLCGVFGFAQVMGALAAGRPTVLLPVFGGAEAARLVNGHRVTHTNGSDDMVDRLLAAGEGARPFPSLRLVGYARFNPGLPDIVERAEAAGITVTSVYGMSECMALFAAQPEAADAARRKQPGGIPIAAEAEVRVRDTETGRLLPPGENGELEVRGPSVMIGYFGNEAATRQTFTEDGFLKTGDLATLTGDGGFSFLNRMGDALRLGGYLVNAEEIEGHILGHPAVAACQVVGAVADGKARAVAFLTLKAGTTADEAAILGHCEGRMARFKVPARAFVVDAFPVTESANGVKIQKAKLREMAQAALDGAAGGPA